MQLLGPSLLRTCPPSASPGAGAVLWKQAQAEHRELLALREQVAELQAAKL